MFLAFSAEIVQPFRDVLQCGNFLKKEDEMLRIFLMNFYD